MNDISLKDIGRHCINCLFVLFFKRLFSLLVARSTSNFFQKSKKNNNLRRMSSKIPVLWYLNNIQGATDQKAKKLKWIQTSILRTSLYHSIECYTIQITKPLAWISNSDLGVHSTILMLIPFNYTLSILLLKVPFFLFFIFNALQKKGGEG